jgi:hypothetical protein
MFEGKPPQIPHSLPDAADCFADEELTKFSWGDLVARLSAERELRAALAPVPSAARASFDDMAARHLANRRPAAACESKSPVNPVASGNGKCRDAKDGSSVDSAWPTVRGIA